MFRGIWILLLVLIFSAVGVYLWQSSTSGATIKVIPLSNDVFKWPYYLYTPSNIEKRLGATYILVRPLNSGRVDDDLSVHDHYAARLITREKWLADALGAPLLIPVFPRPMRHPHTYTHALDRDSLLTNAANLERIDLQLIAMIDDARERLAEKGLSIESKALFTGFSACGSFSIRFTVLHPSRVKAAAVGSPGGWPIAPVMEYKDQLLTYPVGIADLPDLTGSPFDIDTFRTIPIYFYLGDQDANDSVPFQDSFTTDQRDLILNHFGPNPLSRWSIAERLYQEIGSIAQFAIYPGVGHATTDETKRDVLDFLQQAVTQPDRLLHYEDEASPCNNT